LASIVLCLGLARIDAFQTDSADPGFIAAPPQLVFGFFVRPVLTATWIAVSHELDHRPGGIFRIAEPASDAPNTLESRWHPKARRSLFKSAFLKRDAILAEMNLLK
jgi:hypothetical protein